ncbi:hypothetical protein scyTo_0017434 [Scyliorhinus torazame]|uniref:MARVEL domain-containing protein n=1 Tax=Scyliorhinus torazame TaxID=75743 RepID=A0A401PSS3_SCYTO|nr:hypothetical protein [Scyliorhinus torazame]
MQDFLSQFLCFENMEEERIDTMGASRFCQSPALDTQVGFQKLSVYNVKDACYHGMAALFYSTAAVLQANSTLRLQNTPFAKQYQTDIVATIFAFIATVLYVVHAVFSFKRWKTV